MYVCMYINNIFIVYDKGLDWVLKSVENVITLGKLIGLLFYSVSPSSLSLFLKHLNNRINLARPVMRTIFLVIVYDKG